MNHLSLSKLENITGHETLPLAVLEMASQHRQPPKGFDWVEIVYNRERLHSALGFESPVDLETTLN